jgi:glycerol-3-phosphate dehydrogenase
LIDRDIGRATAERHDLLVIGGGIYGAFLAMESARRGLRPLLVEREDFGGGTSWSSLRILHGGLRYLQALDLRRFRESVSERRWFCRTYPDLVEPLECLMPLYGPGLRRPGVFRMALALNDMLSYSRNAEVRPDRHLPGGRVLGASATLARFPLVDRDGLMGAGLWYDAAMPSSARVLMETLRWACRNGATVLNYVECLDLLRDGDVTLGVEALDRTTGDVVELRAPVVVNCAGPSCRTVARRLDRDHEPLFRPSLAFNMLLDRPPPSDAALAVSPRNPAGRTYFLRPWGGRIFAGTFHAPCASYPARSTPTDEQVGRFLDDLNRAVPALELTPEAVVRIYSGLLPASRPGTEDLASRELILEHGSIGGPAGLWSVSGVKYTTARLVAERTLRRIFAASGRDLDVRPGSERPPPALALSPDDPSSLLEHPSAEAVRAVRALVGEEAVTCVEDLVLRRTDWGADPERAAAVAAALGKLLGHELPARPTLHGSRVGADA